MITRQELEGQWNEVKGQLQEKWGALTDDELQQARGNTNQLIGVIQQKTGETRRAIEDFLEEAISGGGTIVQQALDTAKDYADQASEAARHGYEQASDAARKGYDQASDAARRGYEQAAAGVEQAQDLVRRNPMESVAVAFGAGLIAGVVTGLILKSSR